RPRGLPGGRAARRGAARLPVRLPARRRPSRPARRRAGPPRDRRRLPGRTRSLAQLRTDRARRPLRRLPLVRRDPRRTPAAHLQGRPPRARDLSHRRLTPGSCARVAPAMTVAPRFGVLGASATERDTFRDQVIGLLL